MSFLTKLIIGTPINFTSNLLGLPVGTAPSLLNFLLHIDGALAPTLYEYGENGFIKATPGRIVSIEEQAWIDKLNADRRVMEDASRRALDIFLDEVRMHK